MKRQKPFLKYKNFFQSAHEFKSKLFKNELFHFLVLNSNLSCLTFHLTQLTVKK